MRGVAVLWVVLLAACSDRYGTYITVRAPAELAFDRVELFFGVEIGRVTPTTPGRADDVVEESQLLLERLFADADVQTLAAPATELTMFIPDGGKNDALGSYVMAIASRDGQRVAVGELLGFEVTRERVVRLYDLALAPIDDRALEEWGRPEAGCLRWTRARPDGLPVTIAIVRGDDSDCDGFLDHEGDCEPLRYCDGSGTGACIGRTPCVQTGSGCSVGVCSNSDQVSLSCDVDVCVDELLCEACETDLPPDEVFECALIASTTHPANDLELMTRGNGQLCADPTTFHVTLPFACRDPLVEGVGYFQAGPRWDFTVTNDPIGAPSTCTFTIRGPTPDQELVNIPHLLVTVAVGPLQRTGFVIGVKAAQGGPCPAPPIELALTYEPLTGDCPLPDGI